MAQLGDCLKNTKTNPKDALCGPPGTVVFHRGDAPLCRTEVFRKAGFCNSLLTARAEIEQEKPIPPPLSPVSVGSNGAAAIPVGMRGADGPHPEPTLLPAAMLSRHTAILAGTGSGKTVLLRRIIEEAALLGIPAIVLDTNNDLARLGDPWPERPSGWNDNDQVKARRYANHVEVVVWTPGLSGGNPIVLSPLPEFASVRDDADELAKAVEMAHATLAPFIGAAGQRDKLKEGLLADALRAFALTDPSGLKELIEFLDSLPDAASDIVDAAKLGQEIANQLRASLARNRLLAAQGTRLDVQRLLTAAQSGLTRISVINFSGLPSDEARQAFVN
jgi:hypothetical protein